MAALNVTVKGTLSVDRYTVPFLAAKAAFRLRADVEALAVALPVSVSFHTTAPVEVMLGEPHDAVIPFGKPVMLMDDPVPPVAATAPPTGEHVIVAVAVEADGMAIAWGEAVSTAPIAGCTCKVKLLLLLSPSPTAVITSAVEFTGALADAVRVKVSLLLLVPAGGVCGLADHFAVTPTGSPLTE